MAMGNLNFTFTVKKVGSFFDTGGHIFGPAELATMTCTLCQKTFMFEDMLRPALLPPCEKALKAGQGCECGAAKTSGAGAGSPLHSSWCPQRA